MTKKTSQTALTETKASPSKTFDTAKFLAGRDIGLHNPNVTEMASINLLS